MDDIKQAVLEALKEEGYEAEIEDDGDISFEADGEIFYVCFSDDEDDQEYFRVIWLSDSFGADRRAELLDRLNELTLSFRVAKAYLSDADDGTCFVTCAVETFAEVDSFVQFLPDYIGLLQEAAGEVEGF
ncbi:MAG: YbjN domain-containing protein [Desulfovibrio sp.]|nr:YbjN domain-containing protein [Desulfovibrio sp.]MBQ2516057.1 YbjN domain-containing protein [Desulfovibrio sp.]